MKDDFTYESFLNDKTGGFQLPDKNALWPDMKQILDIEMPEEKKRRFFFWFTKYKGFGKFLIALLLVSAGAVAYIVVTDKRTDNTKSNNISSLLAENKTKKNIAVTEPSVTNDPADNVTMQKPDISAAPAEQNTPKVSPEDHAEQIISHAASKYQKLSHVQRAKEVQKINHKNVKGKADAVNRKYSREAASQGSADTNDNSGYTFVTGDDKKQAKQVNNPGFSNTGSSPVIASVQDRERTLNINGPLRLSYSNKNALSYIPVKTGPSSESDAAAMASPPRKLWAAGISLNYNLPVSKQEMSRYNVKGTNNRLLDYIPSVYLRYHFKKQWYIQAEFQHSMPQFTPQNVLFNKLQNITTDSWEENAITLQKLYYNNIPLTVHYSPFRNFYIGSGLQFSSLRSSVMLDEVVLWENGPNGLTKKVLSRNVAVKGGNGKSKGNNGNNGNGNSNNNGNGNGGGNNNGNNNGNPVPVTTQPTASDTAAQSLRSSDWRFLLDANYYWRRFTFGARFNKGLNSYIRQNSGNSVNNINDRNESFQFYLRYNLWESRKKKSAALRNK
jgi:hypothetical protein